MLAAMKPSEPVSHDPKSQVVAQPLPHLSPKEIAAIEGEPLPTVKADADALSARDRVRAAVLHTDDTARIALLVGVDGRTTVIARELEGDAAVLEQLAAQLRLDARDLKPVTSQQTVTLDVVVARMRAFAAQLVMLCASRDVPLPQVPTLPAPPHVPPPRA